MDAIDYSSLHFVKVLPDDTNEWYGTIEEKPQIEQELFVLQENLYTAKTSEEKRAAWSAMLDKLASYAQSFIKQKVSQTSVYIEPVELASMGYHAAVEFMNQYRYKRNYKIQSSFGGLLERRVRTIMYDSKEEDQCVSLDRVIEGTTKEMGDLQVALNLKNVCGPDSQDESPEDAFLRKDCSLMSTIKEVLEEFDFEVDNDETSLKLRFYLGILFKKPTGSQLDKFLKHCTPQEKELIDIAVKEIFDRSKMQSGVTSYRYPDRVKEAEEKGFYEYGYISEDGKTIEWTKPDGTKYTTEFAKEKVVDSSDYED